ncbi:MAG: DoxX family protein [Cytophagales bacterium]|nr:DoxX family protein [Cytophagales bacterium]
MKETLANHMWIKHPLYKFSKIGMGIIFLVPGIFKLLQPTPFMQYLAQSPIRLPMGELMFYPVTIFEIMAGLMLLLPFSVLWQYRRFVYLALAGILAVATVTVVLPDASNMFPDQIEMGRLFSEAHPDRKGLNIDVFPSKLGLISILFHAMGAGILLAMAYTEHRIIQESKK